MATGKRVSKEEELELLWENCVLYGAPGRLRQKSMPKEQREESGEVLSDRLMKLIGKVSLERDKSSKDCYFDGKTPIKIGLVEIKNNIYMTDTGGTCPYVAKTYKLSRDNVVNIISRTKTIKTVMINDEICVKVENSDMLSQAKESLMKMIKIIEVCGGKKNETQS